MHCRPADRADLPTLASLEQALHPTPWSLRQFEDSLSAGHCLLVAEQAGDPVGYAVGHCVLDEAEVLTLGIARAMQGRGLGISLLEALIGNLQQRGARRLFLEVRESNQAAQRLYARAGFVAMGRRKGYYAGPSGREDALTLAKDL